MLLQIEFNNATRENEAQVSIFGPFFCHFGKVLAIFDDLSILTCQREAVGTPKISEIFV